MGLLRALTILAYGVLYIQSICGIRCFRCFDVAHPADCRETALCGQGEICYTREYKDHNGIQGYHLGCQEQNLCGSVVDVSTLIGRRSVDTDPAPSNRCFQCCPGDDCNSKLCHGSGSSSHGHTVSVTTAKPIHVVTTEKHSPINCDAQFLKFKNKCYLIATTPLDWNNARMECQKLGGDLASIDSQQEQDFLKGQLVSLDADTMESFWLGGSYNPMSENWQWADGSTFTFTAWYPGQPTRVSFDSKYFVYMLNPANSFAYSNATWSAWQSTAFGYICEKK